MNAVLKLDDLIESEKKFSLNGKIFTLNTSIKTFVQFLKWNKEIELIKDEEILVLKKIELINLLIQEDNFKEEFEKLSFKSQTKILNKILEIWNNEINNITEDINENKKK